MSFFFAAPILNIALRIATLGTRFALVFILAKYLDSRSVGYYGLFTAAITYAMLCVGLDLYVYTTREIIKLDKAKQGSVLKSQMTVVGTLYVFIAPIAVMLLPTAGLPPFLVWWFLPILILEHLNQELYRLLIMLSQPLTASVLLFIRQGSWAIATAILMIAWEEGRSLNITMLLWTCAGAMAAVLGIYQLLKLRLGGWGEPVDWQWIKKGITVSLSFLLATLALRAIQTFDRYWLERLAGIEFVGAYVLFFGIASALSIFLDAAIFSFRYPEIVTLCHQKKYQEVKRKVMEMGFMTLMASILFSIISLLTLPTLISWIGKDIYLSESGLYYWVLATAIAYGLSMVPHYGLYALGKDRQIIASHVAALLVFVSSTAALSPVSGSYAVPIGALVAMTVVFLWKMAAYLVTFHYSTQRNDEHNPGAA